MSWIRTAVNKAVEAGAEGKNNFTRTVRNYADSVVYHAGNAVSEGAKIIQDRIGPGNMKSFRHTVKMLEEVSVSCRGVERVRLLRRWLLALKESQRLSLDSTESAEKKPQDELSSDEPKSSPSKPALDYYVEPETGGEPRTFRDVFLYSQALEGITLSMILEQPNAEEESLLMEIYGLCLTGGKDVQYAVLNSVQNLARAFSEYQDEVLIKREELLQYAQGAIAGLKMSSDLPRIDAEAYSLKETLGKKNGPKEHSTDDPENSPDHTTTPTIEGLKEALAEVEICTKIEELLLRKKSLSNGDSLEAHGEKINKLKILSESLVNSTSKAEKRILDHRTEKEEALNFRVAKANEMSQAEKELAGEIGQLEKQKDDLEAELKRVNNLLAASRVRLHNAREERDQFDEASNQIIAHLKTKEDELFRSIASCRVEAEVVDAWINFLEHTRALQTSFTEQKEKQVNDELKRHGDYFVNLVIHLLSSYKEILGPSVSQIRRLEEDLTSMQGSEISTRIDDASPRETNQRKKLEEEYVDIEVKIVTTMSIVDTMKKQFLDTKEGLIRNGDEKIQQLFDAIGKINEEFESIRRPKLEIETPTHRSKKPHKKATETQTLKFDEINGSSSIKGVKGTELDSDFRKGGSNDSTEEITDWVFDESETKL